MHPITDPKPTADALVQCRVNGVTHGSYYRGRFPDRRRIGTDVLGVPIGEHNWKQPPEDAAIGCPGAWYRTPFIDSIDEYARRRTSTGDRIENPRFNEADWLIQSAVRYLEDEEERWHLYVEAERHRRWEAEEAKRKQLQQKNAPAKGMGYRRGR